MNKFLLSAFSFLIFSVCAFGQAPRPPADTLTLLRDVNIASPTNGQVLQYDAATGKWLNSAVPNSALSLLTDVSLSAPADGDALFFSGGGSWINRPIAFSDVTGNISVSQMNNGTDAAAGYYYDGTGVWLPLPIGVGGGGIATTDAVLRGDTGGNAIATSMTEPSAGNFAIGGSMNGDMGLTVSNAAANTNVRSLLELTAGTGGDGGIEVFSESSTPSGWSAASATHLFATLGELDISAPALIRLGTTAEKVRIGNGLAVGTTTDPGAGIVNVATGFRIGNAAASGKILQGNGTNYGASTPAWPTSAGTVGPVVGNGANFVVDQTVGVRVTNSATESIPDSAATAITFNTEIRDDGGLHSTSSNTSRLTAATAGWYSVSGGAGFVSNATGFRGLRIRKNGSTFLRIVEVPAISGSATRLSISTNIYLVATDYVELVAFQTSGGALNVESSSDWTPEFEMVKIH